MPWRGKKDVERHNKKCALYAECRKIWLKTANKHYRETGDDGQAVIRANVAAKKWLQSRDKYRRNIDESLRDLERAAERGDDEDKERLRHARIRAGILPPDMPPGGLWVNAYINNQARASLHVQTYAEIDQALDFLRNYFSMEPIAPATSREVFDVSLQRDVTVPTESFHVSAESEPAFDFEQGAAIPRPYTHEPYVSLYLIDPYDDESIMPEPDPVEIDDIILSWCNVYEVTRHYGGPYEGGTYYNHEEPIACLYIHGITVGDSRNQNYPPHIAFARQFLTAFYADREWGDINSVRGGQEIHIINQETPAQRTPPFRYE